MKRYRVVGVILLLVLLLTIPTVAQDPGEGGAIIWPNFGDDIATLNPLVASDGPSHDIIDLIYPKFLGKDVNTKAYTPGTKGSLATAWTSSKDGMIYTFTLRDDWNWSDGTPITSADIQYAWDAISSGEVDFPYLGSVSNIANVETPDPHTVVVTYNQADCQALDNASLIFPVPAHIYEQEFGTDYAAMNEAAEFNLNPPVTAGVFSFKNFRPGEQVTLLADQNYPDAEQGFVIPEGFIYKNLENQTVVVESFLAKEIDIIDSVPDDRRAEILERAANDEFQIFQGPASSWMFMAFNMADPTNPQNGFDEDGNPIEQGHHPVLGDVRVRNAIVRAVDYSELNEKAFFGNGIPIYSPVLTYSWAYNDQLEPYPYDPQGVAALLDDAGWVMNEDTGIRECQGCLYAEKGTPLSFELLSFTGNTSVDAVTVLMKDQLAKVGIDLQLNITEFQTMLEKMDTQAFDSVMLFLGGLDPNNPDELRDIFTPEGDIIGSGFNWGSYNNPEVTELFEKGRALPGCDMEERKEIYFDIQEIMYEEIPWFFVNTTIVPVALQKDIENWKPVSGGGIAWNMDEWYKP